MKKIVIMAIALMLMAGSTSAVYFDDALVDLWNSRPDLQRAFPGNPAGNVKLEAWAKKYGWKENTDLYNFYPDKAVVERIVKEKTEDRISYLESKIKEIESRVGQDQGVILQPVAAGEWRECRILGENGVVKCQTTDEDYKKFSNGNFYIKIMTE